MLFQKELPNTELIIDIFLQHVVLDNNNIALSNLIRKIWTHIFLCQDSFQKSLWAF